MSKYQKFIFKGYTFDASDKTLTLDYSFDDLLNFRETYKFDFDFTPYDQTVLDRAVQLLFFLAGVSYYKTYLAPQIEVEKGQIDNSLAQFLGKTYQRGLGEFFYKNSLDPKTEVKFPVNSGDLETIEVPDGNGMLVGIGGGKDSLVSVEKLRDKVDGLSTWSVGHRPQLTPLVERIGLPHLWVEREWDKQLLELNGQGAYNGHVPISAILAAAGTVAAVLSGKRDVVVSNEQSANEPTLHYQGVAINHQYSKSQEFEEDYQALLKRTFGESVRYYSLLRPFSELAIAEMFAQSDFEKYKDVFSSCNRAFTHYSDHMFWDGTCSKCAFIFLALTPFIDRSKLEELFSGKNLLLNSELERTYKQLLGIDGDKPLECVGEIKECREAMTLAKKIYPELEKYQYELPDNYDFRALQSHSMPEDVTNLVE